MKFHLRVYDNFHYMDESEAYNHGEYETFEEALIAAKAIVEEFFVSNWKTAPTARDLAAQYFTYGEDPIILPNEHGEHSSFSAWTYAEKIHETIFKRLQDENENKTTWWFWLYKIKKLRANLIYQPLE